MVALRGPGTRGDPGRPAPGSNDDPVPHGVEDQLGIVADPQFAQNARAIGDHGLDDDEYLLTDLRERRTLDHNQHDLVFARGQLLMWHWIVAATQVHQYLLRTIGCQIAAACRYLADRLDQFGRVDILGHVAVCAGPD